MIYAVAGLCVLVLRRRQSDTQRSFLIPLGPVIPVATIVIFSLLGVIAAVTLTPVRIGGAELLLPVPLAITAAIFLLSFLYVQILRATIEGGGRGAPRGPDATTTPAAGGGGDRADSATARAGKVGRFTMPTATIHVRVPVRGRG